MNFRPLGQKQREDNTYWCHVWEHITEIISEAEVRELVNQAVREVEQTIRSQRVGWAWSGGKDSQALRVVMEQAGIERCVLAMTAELEYPEFLRWVTDQMPPLLDVIETGQTLDWLASNQQMLFPQDSKTAAKWFKVIQHYAQDIFYKRYNLDVIVLGRRHQDQNYTGKDGTGIYTNRKSTTRYSPIRYWTHEQIMGVCYYYQMPMAPFYSWPNGFVVGSGCWPARQWTGSTENGWREVYSIDPSVVHQAANYLPSAYEFLAKL